MGTGSTYSARDWAPVVNVVTPSARAKNEPMGPLMVTMRRRLFEGSLSGVTVTPPEPFVYPFLVASARADEYAVAGSPGRYTAPASAAASAARCIRCCPYQTQLMSVTIATAPIMTTDMRMNM